MRIMKGKVIVTALSLVFVLTLIVPTVVSARPHIEAEKMWRGGIYVYGRCYNSSDDSYYWMEVHSKIYESYDGDYRKVEEEINGDTEDVYYVTCTARHTGHSTKTSSCSASTSGI